MRHITRRTALKQLASLPLLTAVKTPASVPAPPSQLNQLNIILHGLAILVVYSDSKPRIEIVFPTVPGHTYLGGNFLGTPPNDLKDSAPLDPGETYRLDGVVPGLSVPQFEKDYNLIIPAPPNGSYPGIYIDPENKRQCRLILPYPSMGVGYSYQVAKVRKPQGTTDKPFVSGTGPNQGSTTQLSLVHVLRYQISDPAKLHLQLTSSPFPFKWAPQPSRTNSAIANLLFYAEPTLLVGGAHAAMAFELLTDLLPLKHASGKLDLHFLPLDPGDICIANDPDRSVVCPADGASLPTPPLDVDPINLLSLVARATHAVVPANCVRAIVYA